MAGDERRRGDDERRRRRDRRRRPSASAALGHAPVPRRRQAGINEGNSLPGVKIEGLGGSPLSMLPAAPAADLGGGGMIAGDPIFDVKEIGVALDQLAREILRHLKDHKLTVVWLFDESESMKDDQKAIREKFDRVSTELKVNIEPGKKAAGALNHAIVGFGQDIDYELEKPTRRHRRRSAGPSRSSGSTTSGTENTMHAIREVVEHYAGLIGKDRKLLIVLVTDESGDDGGRRRGGPPGAEEAQGAALRHRPPVALRLRRSPTTATSTR